MSIQTDHQTPAPREQMYEHLLTVNRNNFVIPLLLDCAVGICCGCSSAPVAQKADKGAAPRTINVCDLFKDLVSYRGKTVAVRGIYWYGLRQNCPQPFVMG